MLDSFDEKFVNEVCVSGPFAGQCCKLLFCDVDVEGTLKGVCQAFEEGLAERFNIFWTQRGGGPEKYRDGA